MGDAASNVGTLLIAEFNAVYPGDLVVGGTNTISLTDAGAVIAYLPAIGGSAALNSSVIDPLSTSAGEFGGEVTALKLNIDFSSRLGNAVELADLRICNFSTLPSLNGQTVAQFLATANHILGGGSATFGPSTGAAIARLINGAFANGSPSTFAQANLVAGNCPSN